MNINFEYMTITLSNQLDQVKAGSASCLFRRDFLAVNRKHPFLVYPEGPWFPLVCLIITSS